MESMGSCQVQKRIIPKLFANGRSDLHVYFWAHAASFLKPGGMLGFLTSSQWLDVEYGFSLQRWLLERFKIIAILESYGEPWFQGARVATAVTVAQLVDGEIERNSNIVRFVEIRKPIADLIGRNGSRDMLVGAERLRDRLLCASHDTLTDDFRIRMVPQGDLLNSGIALNRRMTGKDEYLGGKWGIPLRAPDLWFDLLRAGADRWRPLGELAEVRFGVKSGCDDFFYVRDASAKVLSEYPREKEFREHYGVARSRVDNGEVVIALAGTGEAFPVERCFLAPIVHSLMDVDRYEIGPENCERLALMVPSNAPLEHTLVRKYILWGERQRYHMGATCAARENDVGRRWYDLTDARRAAVLWVKERQYRFAAPLNTNEYLANCRLYTVFVDDAKLSLMCGAVLNSTLTIMSTLMFGRPVGVEANWSTMVSDVHMMLVPDWTKPSPEVACKLETSISSLRARNVLGLLSERRLRTKSFTERGQADQLDSFSDTTELDQRDRHELDNAVLELLGVTSEAERRTLLQRLYGHLREYFEKERRKEEEAIDNKRQAKAKTRQTPENLAQSVFDLVREQSPNLLRSYEDFADPYGQDVLDDARFIPRPDKLKLQDDLLGAGLFYRSSKTGKPEMARARHPAQAALMFEIALLGEGDDTYFVPSDPDICKKLGEQIRSHRLAREGRARALLEDRTADPDLVEKALPLVLARFRNPLKV